MFQYIVINPSKMLDNWSHSHLIIERNSSSNSVESRLFYKNHHLATLIHTTTISIDIFHEEAFESIFESEYPTYVRLQPNHNTFNQELADLSLPWDIIKFMYTIETQFNNIKKELAHVSN